MLTPAQFLNTANFSGQLSLPPATPFSLLNLNNLPNIGGTPPFVAQDKDQIVNAQSDTPDCGSLWSIDPRCKNSIQNPNDLFAQFFGFDWSKGLKSAGLLIIAAILLAFGLYMLARSTDTGKIVINSAKMAAV